jgi:hypothetical protein
MKPVERSELLALGPYEQVRDRFRQRVIALKKNRRVQLGANMSLVFENHDTVLLQVQEMLRTERISDERAIAHELETYNELIAKPGALVGTLFIEYDDPAQRRAMLERFASLRQSLHLRIAGRRITARFSTHFGEEMDRLPAVNYVTFELGADAERQLRDSSVPAQFEIDHPDYPLQLPLTRELREELANDLAD